MRTVRHIVAALAAAGALVLLVAATARVAHGNDSSAEARAQVRRIARAVTHYQAENVGCPDSLEVVYREHYVDGRRLDPWGRELLFHCGASARSMEVRSAGPDGLFGTADDVRSWE